MAKKAHALRGIRILHEDPDVIVIEKAAGILSQETYYRNGGQGCRGGEYCVLSALTQWVRKGQSRSTRSVYLVHRLDRETSGVMMVAKTPEVQEYFRSQWNEITRKTYLARVEGAFAETSGVFESYLAEGTDLRVRSTTAQKGKWACTQWRVCVNGERPLVEVSLKSGRKNQIRVHFAEAGHPVVGDGKYGKAPAHARLCLHAQRLSFVHPHTRKWVTFEAQLPPFVPDRFDGLRLMNENGNEG